MAIKTKDEIIKMVADRIGDDNSDEAIAFLEDVSDTFDDLEARVSERADGEDWEARYRENDAAWRQRYKERFFNSVESEDPQPKKASEEEEVKNYTYEELFKEKKED